MQCFAEVLCFFWCRQAQLWQNCANLQIQSLTTQASPYDKKPFDLLFFPEPDREGEMEFDFLRLLLQLWFWSQLSTRNYSE
jgi:hypothetical protein